MGSALMQPACTRVLLLLRERGCGSRYAPVMLGASRHDRRCESEDTRRGATSDRATEGLPNRIPASRQIQAHIRAGGFSSHGRCERTTRDAHHASGPRFPPGLARISLFLSEKAHRQRLGAP